MPRFHTRIDDDLERLLKEAQHQRVVLISGTYNRDTKSTVLTHVCNQIKQKFPDKCVVRFDINDHTEALKTLREKQIDKEKDIEFLSEKVLKDRPGLEVELFKEGCELMQKVKIVTMLDVFGEISTS
jgi:hypothetical protein